MKLQYTFPEKNFEEIKKKVYGQKFFYLEKKMIPEKFNKITLLGEKSIRLEKKITRIYPHKNLFSHVLGQIDDENNGISGLEKSLDAYLKKSNTNLQLTLDSNIQFLIRNELIKFNEIFRTALES